MLLNLYDPYLYFFFPYYLNFFYLMIVDLYFFLPSFVNLCPFLISFNCMNFLSNFIRLNLYFNHFLCFLLFDLFLYWHVFLPLLFWPSPFSSYLFLPLINPLSLQVFFYLTLHLCHMIFFGLICVSCLLSQHYTFLSILPLIFCTFTAIDDNHHKFTVFLFNQANPKVVEFFYFYFLHLQVHRVFVI